jgi:hypothetical protein
VLDRLTFRTLDALGYLLCELAFKTGCRGPFAWAYRGGATAMLMTVEFGAVNSRQIHDIAMERMSPEYICGRSG